jgi:hypothetical protein
MSETLKEFPQLQQVEVDDALLDALVTDLTALTEILCVMPKAGAGRVVPKTVPLDKGVQLLRDNTLRGLQIRYRYEGDEWWDTLMQTPDGIRLTRIKQEY